VLADPHDLLGDLDPAQRAAVTSPATPLAIVAPAGSGKTRVLARRIAWRVATGDADPRHVLALTFTRKAAGELASRLRALGLRADLATGTFHAVAYAQLRALWAERGWTPPALLASKASLLADLPEVRRSKASPADVATEIDWAKARVIAADRYAEEVVAARRRPRAPARVVADLYAAYEEAKRARRLVDFDDLLRLCIDAIESDPSFAAVQRWRFRHLFVDEFQDVNALQFRLLEAWRGTHYDLCVVGDPQQAIYGWNGADARYIADIRAHYPPAEVVVLDRNYRSTPQILAAASTVLDAGGLDGATVSATRADGRAPVLERHDTDADEAVAIARAVRDRHGPGAPWSAQAVLVRTHGQTRLILEALRTSGIPARVRGTAAVLEHKAVRELVDVLTASRAPLRDHLPDLERLDVDAEGDRDLKGALEVVADLAREHLRLQPDAPAAGFAAWLRASLRAEAADLAGDAVDVVTFHAAKGLEWPIVHLAGLEDGFVPIAHARTRAARAEEARLLYVAMTRAERELRCTWAGQRAFGSRLVQREMSPLLRPFAAGQAAARREAPGSVDRDPAWREQLETERARLAAQRDLLARAIGTPRAAPGIVAALRLWRDEAARAARIAPASVLPDRVVDAIAVARPADLAELAAVEGVGSLLAARLGDGILAAIGAREATAGPA
jgi:DNA helicase-2/ATP-dependent DNA helicase PcrA